MTFSLGNYMCDALGNRTVDKQSNITGITWSVYNKIETITKTDWPNISYTYNPAQQRASKLSNSITT